MCNNNYVINLLDLQDENLEIVKSETINDEIIYTIKLNKFPDDLACPECGSGHYNIHAKHIRVIKHTKINTYNSIINYIQDRVICMDCGKTYNVPCPFCDKNDRLSKNLKKNIIEDTSKKVSFKDVAENSDVSETTIISIFKKQIHEYRCNLTEIVCVDEFKASTIAGTYALIIGDPVSGTILDILPSRRQDYILYYFQTIDFNERNKINYLVTDLNEAYRSVFKLIFPNATFIADRFHWIRQSTEAFNKIRIRLMNSHLKNYELLKSNERFKEKDYADLLKKNYKLLLANRCSKPPMVF